MSNDPVLTLPYLAERIREYASLFQTGLFPTVASILNKIAGSIESGNVTEEALDETYKTLQEALQPDYLQGVSWRKDILDDVDSLLKKGLKPAELKEALEILKRTQRPQETFLRILIAATQQKDDLTQLYLLCFLYLILVEGVYDDVLRFLHALYTGRPSTNTEIKDIRDQFNRDGVGQSLFKAWNSTVRNGIAHATFSLDVGSQRAHFEDQRSGKSENLTFEEFRIMAQKIFDVGTAVQVLIIRVLVPMNFQEVLRSIQTQRGSRQLK